ncbi:MAG TPA: DUF4331 domain-containing protein [Blastocatellia bacterium]
MMKLFKISRAVVALVLAAGLAGPLFASSHMDAPLITLDPAANTTDVYAFTTTDNGTQYLNVALSVYPFEEPGIGPNKYNFDDNVLYQIHVSTGSDMAAGNPTFSYQFRFNTSFKDLNTILQSYLGVIQTVGDANQNLTQTYTVTKVNDHTGQSTVLGTGIVPPNNQGIATPLYNQGNDGNNLAKFGVSTAAQLDPYTSQSIAKLNNGYIGFAGQRHDGFFGDINAIFDLLSLRNPGQNAQQGFNVHMMALKIPVSELGGNMQEVGGNLQEVSANMQVVGVYATTSRQSITVLNGSGDTLSGGFVQVGRQGNPLFCEGLVALVDKDNYNRTTPAVDQALFSKYALNPELATLINEIVFKSSVAPETDRTDIKAIFIPDMIKVDLSTGPVRLAGNGPNDPNNPDDPGFSNLGIFGGDTLHSRVQGGFDGKGTVSGGWPNGRRFGDDVVTIAVTALISDLRTTPPTVRGPAGDNVGPDPNGYNKVLPYEATPNNGRNHTHAE